MLLIHIFNYFSFKITLNYNDNDWVNMLHCSMCQYGVYCPVLLAELHL
jgi:hypothetical protein